ncbi:hypothetical protein [Planctomycetes bacterium TBK1r]|uniref:Uncharacterized protein n=1 Tax=Stieleria magnilauensis TaxID=2527963 RepID=A0ABX5XI46_9BACT|nr:hypothetical protein TBK1r_05870 [Planctomycetes bacterium TBK1r]
MRRIQKLIETHIYNRPSPPREGETIPTGPTHLDWNRISVIEQALLIQANGDAEELLQRYRRHLQRRAGR